MYSPNSGSTASLPTLRPGYGHLTVSVSQYTHTSYNSKEHLNYDTKLNEQRLLM